MKQEIAGKNTEIRQLKDNEVKYAEEINQLKQQLSAKALRTDGNQLDAQQMT